MTKLPSAMPGRSGLMRSLSSASAPAVRAAHRATQMVFCILFLRVTAGRLFFPMRSYLCNKAHIPFSIDGDLTKAPWQAAPWTDDFVDIEGNIRPKPRFRTRAKMLWDDTHFYVAAYLDEPHVWA